MKGWKTTYNNKIFMTQANLWGTPQCTKGWDARCAQALKTDCECACDGANHGVDSPNRSVGEPIKNLKEKLIMTVEVYKKRLGYIASGTHNGNDYSFAGFAPMEAIEKALNYIAQKPTPKLKITYLGNIESIEEKNWRENEFNLPIEVPQGAIPKKRKTKKKK